MRLVPTRLAGLSVVELDRIEDERGFFARSFCAEEFAKAGLAAAVAQCNVSFNRTRGTLRGMHWAAHPHAEAKLVRCTAGAIFDVAVDIRPTSPTYLQWEGVELSATNHRALFIPVGFAHGFQTLADASEVFYQMSTAYAPGAGRGARWNDAAFGIRWPLPDPVLSERDRGYADFRRGDGSESAGHRRLRLHRARVVRQLLARDHAVTVLAQPGDPLRRLQGVAGVDVIEADLANLDAARDAITRAAPDGCIHLAWYAEPGVYLTSERNFESLAGSIALARLLLGIGCKRLVMAGTCAEYDTDPGWLREDGPTRPATLYAAAKLSMCLMGEQLAALHDARFAWGRIIYLYGPDEDPRRAIPALIRTLLAGGTFDASEGRQIRDYLHVDDVAAGFVTLLENDTARGIFNIASARPLTMRDIMSEVERACGSEGRIRFGAQASRPWDPPCICGTNQRLRSLGWVPQFDLR